ncbi:MAG: rhomboid family intramembrane serine protease [Halobacteriovoraceae bacterium]|jgi:rhomboid protease GluP|nr:rhomboid family intramembrane serine protease [Halobacteriovoraceae bacterium]
MTIESKLVKTYLNHPRYPNAKITAIFLLLLSIILSNFHWHDMNALAPFLAAKKSQVFESGEYWRLFTTTFVHGNLEHLLSNSMMLVFLSYFVSAFYGQFLTFLATIITGALINYFVLYNSSLNITIVGISGVIYFLWGFWLILYLFIEQRITFFRRLINIIALFLILLIPTSYAPQTSYTAHYFGFFVGVVFAFIYYPFNSKKFKKYHFYEYRYIPNLEENTKHIETLYSTDN